MMTVSKHLAIILLLILIVAARISVAADVQLARGSQLVQPYKGDLQTALRAGMAQGVVEAIQVCRVQAPLIAESLATDGVRIGRSSHRLRNPENAAPAWVAEILNVYLENPSDRQPRAVELQDGRYGYTEPIVLQPLCLACHGVDIDASVASRIDELYPEDRAVGFSVGDLRGVFWVEFPEQQ